jgi:hypothetical protein
MNPVENLSQAMRRLLLTLLSTPALLGSALCYLTVLSPAHAAQPMVKVTETLYCEKLVSSSDRRFTCQRVNNATGKTTKEIIDLTSQPKSGLMEAEPDDPNMLDFTEEESEAAAALFGCDCQVCLNALRQLRGMSLS